MEIRDFGWLFNEQGKVAEGKECVVFNDYEYDYVLVTLAGYRPYYTDGTPDPSNEDVNEWCYIEVCGDIDDSQVRLENLYEFKREEEDKEVLYNGEMHKVIGTFEVGEEIHYIIENNGMNSDHLTVTDEDIEERRELSDLNEEELETFYKNCTHGSIYLSDYHNSLGIEIHDASSIADLWQEYLCDEGKENIFEEFKHWVALGAYC